MTASQPAQSRHFVSIIPAAKPRSIALAQLNLACLATLAPANPRTAEYCISCTVSLILHLLCSIPIPIPVPRLPGLSRCERSTNRSDKEGEGYISHNRDGPNMSSVRLVQPRIRGPTNPLPPPPVLGQTLWLLASTKVHVGMYVHVCKYMVNR